MKYEKNFNNIKLIQKIQSTEKFTYLIMFLYEEF